MTLAVPLSPESEARLRDRAQAAGIEETAYAAKLLEEKLCEPESIVQISGELHQRFLDSGMTEEELTRWLEDEKHSARAERRGITFHE
jgi:hypothetical protein